MALLQWRWGIVTAVPPPGISKQPVTDDIVTKKKILVLYFTQSGQLSDVVRSVTAPLLDNPHFDVSFEAIKPVQPYPFPWPFLRFFDTFPETVYEDVPAIQPLSAGIADQPYDLVILAYQVWFLSPSQPTTAFLQSPEAKKLLRDTPVVTLIACRNMWLMAQETMKRHLSELGAHLVDNIVLTDPAHSAMTFFSTPMWVLTGHKGPFLFGLVPPAGVSPDEVANARRFGEAIARQLPGRDRSDQTPMLTGLGAVTVNERLIPSERIALRSFRIWGGLLRLLGKPGTPLRRTVLVAYIIFLITLILTVVPITAVIKRLFAPLMKARIARQRAYFSAPSGETTQV